MEYEDLEKIIANKIALSYDFARGFLYSYLDIARGILSLDGIEIKSDDQRLPENPHVTLDANGRMLAYDADEANAYGGAQEDMLKPDSEGKHFIRVIPKPKRK